MICSRYDSFLTSFSFFDCWWALFHSTQSWALQLHVRGPPGRVNVYIRPATPGDEGTGGTHGLVMEVATKNVRRLQVDEVARFVGHAGGLQLQLDGTSVMVEGANAEARGGGSALDEAVGAAEGHETALFAMGQPSTQAAPGGRGELPFYCTDSRGRVGEGGRRWQPCYPGVSDGQSDGSNATCGCCGVGERMAAAGAGPIRRVFARPFVIVYGTGSSQLLDEYLGLAQVTSRWFTETCVRASGRVMFDG